MNFSRLIFIGTLIITVSISCSGRTLGFVSSASHNIASMDKKKSQLFIKSQGFNQDEKIGEETKYSVNTNNGKYEIFSDGTGKYVDKNGKLRLFQIKLDPSEKLSKVIYAIHDRDMIILAEQGDDESLGGLIFRLDTQTLKIKWKRDFPAFNIGIGVIESGFAYITGIGFVAKVNLQSGTYAWQHKNLYEAFNSQTNSGGNFNSFQVPEIIGNEIVFTESDDLSTGKRLKKIRVNKTTGNIIKTK
jgi:hypothetical protein